MISAWAGSVCLGSSRFLESGTWSCKIEPNKARVPQESYRFTGNEEGHR